jgi:hypothetical protein
MAELHLLRADLVRRLGATVGLAKAQQAIDGAARTLTLPDAHLSLAQCFTLLERLGATTDIVGIAARLLKAQLMLESGTSRGGTPVPA